MMAYCNMCSARGSLFAPASIKTKMFVSDGITAAIPGRSTPGSVRNLIVVAATAAPVCPALTIAVASPFLTRSTARLTDESFFRRTASTAPSLISTTCVACTISMRRSLQRCCFSSFSIRGVSPTRNSFAIWGYSFSAMTAPPTIFGGPKSPPMASSAIFIGARFCGFQGMNAKSKNLNMVAAFVSPHLPARRALRGAKAPLQATSLRPSGPAGRYNNRRMDKPCARRRCFRTGCIC